MKIVSPKTFIVSLLLGILVLYKVLSIDGFTDILWIILMGYWTIRGMEVAFSQESCLEYLFSIKCCPLMALPTYCGLS